MTTADVLALLDPPLWIVTAADGDRRGGLVATNVAGASIVPDLPRIAVGLARQHHTWGLVEASGALTLHLLTAEAIDLVWRFGLTSGRDADKLAGVAWTPGPTGSPVLAGALAWLACRVEARFDTGDRTLFLCEVVAAGGDLDGKPITVGGMLARATAEQKAELKRLYDRDAAIDAAAIRAWRGSR